MFKKFIILGAPLLLLVDTSLFAGGMNGYYRDKDAPLVESSAFSLSIAGLYYKAYSNFLPSTFNNNYVEDTSFSTESLNAPSNWGGIIEGRYIFSDTKDLSLNWMHYSVGYRGRSIDQDPPSRVSYTLGKIRINSIDLELGHSFDLSSSTSVRLSGGGQYLNIKNNSTNSTTSLNQFEEDGVITVGIDASYPRDKYEGAGPRIGLDAQTKLGENISIFANGAATIILARHTGSRFSSDQFGNQGAKTFGDDTTFPEIEEKLGLTYMQPINHGIVSLSAGWSAITYFHLLESENLTLSGPFIQAKWVG